MYGIQAHSQEFVVHLFLFSIETVIENISQIIHEFYFCINTNI